VLLELSGSFPQGGRLEFADDFLNESCFQLTIDSTSVQPEWRLDEIDASKRITTEGAFRSKLIEMIIEAEKQGNDNEANRLRNALFYGLDALSGRQIMPR